MRSPKGPTVNGRHDDNQAPMSLKHKFAEAPRCLVCLAKRMSYKHEVSPKSTSQGFPDIDTANKVLRNARPGASNTFPVHITNVTVPQ
jgi:hypothetical protein